MPKVFLCYACIKEVLKTLYRYRISVKPFHWLVSTEISLDDPGSEVCKEEKVEHVRFE